MDMTAEFLEGCRDEYENGNKWALMQALAVCATENIPLPKWAAKVFIEAVESARIGKAKSWDDLFDSPYPKGTHLNSIKKKHQIRWQLYERVKELAQSMPIDESLFEKIGKEFYIGKTLASEYYYDAKNIAKNFGCD